MTWVITKPGDQYNTGKIVLSWNNKPLVYQQKPVPLFVFLKTNADSGKSAVDRATKWASMVRQKLQLLWPIKV